MEYVILLHLNLTDRHATPANIYRFGMGVRLGFFTLGLVQ